MKLMHTEATRSNTNMKNVGNNQVNQNFQEKFILGKDARHLNIKLATERKEVYEEETKQTIFMQASRAKKEVICLKKLKRFKSFLKLQ